MIDPMTGSMIMQGVGQLAGGLFKPRRSKTLGMQESYARSKMGYIPYFDNMMKQGQAQQNQLDAWISVWVIWTSTSWANAKYTK